MNMAVRILLIQGLAQHFRGMSEAQAKAQAHDLTCCVSSEVAKASSISGPHLPCFPKESWNELTVGVPWEAFSLAYSNQRSQPIASRVQAVCSAPAHLDAALANQALDSGLWGGSLLVALGEILKGARHELFIFSPYWRVDGVRSLLSAVGRKNYLNVHVQVITQPQARMKRDDREGLVFFIDTMILCGATVRVCSPVPVDGFTPFLHAKLIIADAEKAYVGSANFTSSGLDHGLEAGILVEGEAAQSFSLWANAIVVTCEPWRPEPAN